MNNNLDVVGGSLKDGLVLKCNQKLQQTVKIPSKERIAFGNSTGNAEADAIKAYLKDSIAKGGNIFSFTYPQIANDIVAFGKGQKETPHNLLPMMAIGNNMAGMVMSGINILKEQKLCSIKNIYFEGEEIEVLIPQEKLFMN